MSLTKRQRAAVLAMRDLDARDGRDAGWDTASIQVAARPYPSGDNVDERTIGSLVRKCVIVRRSRDLRYELTESGRVRIKEGL